MAPINKTATIKEDPMAVSRRIKCFVLASGDWFSDVICYYDKSWVKKLQSPRPYFYGYARINSVTGAGK
ncbi:uncharacterized protein Dvar_44600 [Desulfosarcina variabilis str. Montpellier]